MKKPTVKAKPEAPEIQWAIVEIFGHSRYAGIISEHAIGGCSFVRVDVPETGEEPAFTKLFGQGAIYRAPRILSRGKFLQDSVKSIRSPIPDSQSRKPQGQQQAPIDFRCFR